MLKNEMEFVIFIELKTSKYLEIKSDSSLEFIAVAWLTRSGRMITLAMLSCPHDPLMLQAQILPQSHLQKLLRKSQFLPHLTVTIVSALSHLLNCVE